MAKGSKLARLMLACAERDGHWQCTYCGVKLIRPGSTEGTRKAPAEWYENCPNGDHPFSPCWHPGWTGTEDGYEWPASDHVIPKTKGGSDEIGNRVNTCNRCNSIKGSRMLQDLPVGWWRAGSEYLDKHRPGPPRDTLPMGEYAKFPDEPPAVSREQLLRIACVARNDGQEHLAVARWGDELRPVVDALVQALRG